ncbi:MAG: transketolase [Alphaproteobacteria bacterium]|nr:transketolase [Alphaproteobacteria bacterium]
MRHESKQLQEMAGALRSRALGALRASRSGHVGIVLGAADIVTTIFANFLRLGVDKFVLSAGHGSALLYSVLKLSGHDIGDLERFRALGGLPGHPELGIDGVAATTGPLGQGIGNAVGIAMGAKIRRTGARVYCLCSDGDLMEGVANESIAFAGRYKLDNLVLLWDDNGISIDGIAQTDVNIPRRMAAAGWTVISAHGNNFKSLNAALERAGQCNGPVFVQCRTIIGAGSSLAGLPRAHGLALGDAEMAQLMAEYASRAGEKLWAAVARRRPRRAEDKPCIDAGAVPVVDVPTVDAAEISTRELSGMYLERLAAAIPCLIGGSADLAASTNAKTKSHRDITADDFSGNFINYGVREHAMGAIMNGLVTCGLRPYGSTFLVFSDYMRPSIRLAALSGLPVVYILTHDSVAVGEDGPTHQPVEQLPSLRLMPNLNVFRPCNMAEVVYAWRTALGDVTRPSCIILSRQKIQQIDTPDTAQMMRGGYVIYPAQTRRVRMTLVATGAEVPLAVSAARKLSGVQVVSMPNVAAFRMQSSEYRRRILAGYVVSVEAAATAPWFEFADAAIGIDSFGASGPGDDVYRAFGFDTDALVREISKFLK